MRTAEIADPSTRGRSLRAEGAEIAEKNNPVPVWVLLCGLLLLCVLCGFSALGCTAANPADRSGARVAPATAGERETEGRKQKAEGRKQPFDTSSAAPAEETVDLWIDSADRKLGAYQLRLTFDPAASAIEEIGGGAEPFDARPLTNPAGLTGGEAVLAGQIDPARAAGRIPNGLIRVATLRFKLVSGRSTAISVKLDSLFDPDGRPIEGKAILSRDRLGGPGR